MSHPVRATDAWFSQAQPSTEILVSVSAIVPDDGEHLESFVRATVAALDAYYVYYELLLIDNGSPLDVQWQIQGLQRTVANVRMVRLSRKYSKELALAAAFDHCIGDYVILIDPLIHPPEQIPRLVAAAATGCDSVMALSSSRRETILDRVVCGPVYRLVSSLLGFELRPNESTYRVFSRRLVNSIVRIRSKNRYLSYLNASVGLRQSIIWYESNLPERRLSSIRNMCRQLNTISNILVSNSAVPLRFAALMGVLASTGNLLYLVYILIVTLVKSRIAEGWLTLSLTSTTMFFFLFVILTVMAGYVARILDESKEQPLYFVESETNSSVSSTGQQRLNVIQERVSPTATGGANDR